MTRRLVLSALSLGLVLVGAIAPAGAEEPGTWRFKKDDRPIKAVVVGGSVTAWPRGSFGHFIEAACPRVEVKRKGKARLGSAQLKSRFYWQVVRNRRVKSEDHEALWLIFQGGLNSIATPEMTNRDTADIFKMAHKKGMKVLALTVGPWGAQSDKRRWRYANGLRYKRYTQSTVDFVMGRLSVQEALGRFAVNRDAPQWLPEEKPDIAIDLYDSPLRDKDAELVEEEVARRYTERNPWVREQLKGLASDAERKEALAAFVQEVRELPRWFMKKELHAFDHIHPNMEGHRLMAQTICPELPSEWSCSCEAMASMTWDRKKGKLTPQVEIQQAAQ